MHLDDAGAADAVVRGQALTSSETGVTDRKTAFTRGLPPSCVVFVFVYMYLYMFAYGEHACLLYNIKSGCKSIAHHSSTGTYRPQSS